MTPSEWLRARKSQKNWADRKDWVYNPSKAYRYPSWWLLLTTEERFELQALGHVPQPMRADQFVDSSRPADW